MGIKVKVVRLGFYNNQRMYDGDEFEIKDEHEFGDWMERTEPLPDKNAPSLLDEVGEPGGDIDDSADLVALAITRADELEAQAAEARAAVKGNSPKAFKEQVAALEAQAAEAREVADKLVASANETFEG